MSTTTSDDTVLAAARALPQAGPLCGLSAADHTGHQVKLLCIHDLAAFARAQRAAALREAADALTADNPFSQYREKVVAPWLRRRAEEEDRR